MASDPKKILVVEDNPDVLVIIQTALRERGYDAVTANGGEEALEKVKVEDFDLILTDLAMPKVSGVDLIRAFKNSPRTWRIPIVAVTAHWTDQISVSASAAGCDGFIAKPFSREELLYEVEKHLALRKQK
jgi:CheY-like chemotaxis protein